MWCVCVCVHMSVCIIARAHNCIHVCVCVCVWKMCTCDLIHVCVYVCVHYLFRVLRAHVCESVCVWGKCVKPSHAPEAAVAVDPDADASGAIVEVVAPFICCLLVTCMMRVPLGEGKHSER